MHNLFKCTHVKRKWFSSIANERENDYENFVYFEKCLDWRQAA